MKTLVRILLSEFPADLHDELRSANLVEGKHVALDPSNPEHLQLNARMLERRRAQHQPLLPQAPGATFGGQGSATPSPQSWEVQGPALWAKLHLCKAPSQAVIDEITASFPPGCGCKDHWLEMLAQTPPPLYSGADWRRWTFYSHNQVNRKLKKPELTWEAACAQWGWPDWI